MTEAEQRMVEAVEKACERIERAWLRALEEARYERRKEVERSRD